MMGIWVYYTLNDWLESNADIIFDQWWDQAGGHPTEAVKG